MSDVIPCRACGASANYIFSGSVIDETVRYYECDSCHFVQTEDPYWLDKAYASAINDSDTGLVGRNICCARLTVATLLAIGNLKGRVVDFAGGYGLLTRLLRDMGVEAQWSDPFCNNLLAKGFEHDGNSADLVTAFEAFEHFVDPILETEKMFAIGPTILFSTTLCPTPTPAHNDWWYYGKEHGQHISLYRVQSLRMLANRFNAKLITNGVDLHILTRRDISERRWQLFTNRRIVRFIPFLIQKRLASKTWSDHEIMARSQTTRLA
jgi:hypothetical protein